MKREWVFASAMLLAFGGGVAAYALNRLKTSHELFELTFMATFQAASSHCPDARMGAALTGTALVDGDVYAQFSRASNERSVLWLGDVDGLKVDQKQIREAARYVVEIYDSECLAQATLAANAGRRLTQ